MGFALVAALASEKAPNKWGRKVIATNPTGLRWDVTTVTAGNTAVEILMVMGAVRLDQNLVALQWGGQVEIRDECKDWCVPFEQSRYCRVAERASGICGIVTLYVLGKEKPCVEVWRSQVRCIAVHVT